jgi:hypothetical protein
MPRGDEMNKSLSGQVTCFEASPSGDIVRLSDGVSDDLPSKKNTGFAQRGRLSMPKHNSVFRLEGDHEVLTIAANGYLPAKWSIGFKSCGQWSPRQQLPIAR